MIQAQARLVDQPVLTISSKTQPLGLAILAPQLVYDAQYLQTPINVLNAQLAAGSDPPLTAKRSALLKNTSSLLLITV